MAGGKKKAVKVSWQELQVQYGDVSRNPLDNLPTSSRSHADNPRDSYRSSFDRERRERREDRDDAVSRADESSAWRSAKPASLSSNRDDQVGRSDDGVWRTSRPASSSSFGNSFSRREDFPQRRDDMQREPDASGRPRLILIKPSADRINAAKEQQIAAKATLFEERLPSKPNPFGDAKPVPKSNPFGDAKPVGVTPDKPASTAEAWRPRFSRDISTEPPSQSTRAGDESSSRFARPADEPTSRFARSADEFASRFARPADEPTSRFARSADEFASRFARPADEPTSRFARSADEFASRFARPADEPTSRFARSADESTSRFSRPADESTSRFSLSADEPTNRITRSADEPTSAPIRPRGVLDAEPTPSPLIKKTATSAKVKSQKKSGGKEPKPQSARTPNKEPESSGPIRSPLDVSMTDGTWVTADELADCIGSVSLDSDESVDALSNVIALSLAQKTVLLPSVIALIPQDKLAAVVQNALLRLQKTLSAERIEDIIRDVDVVKALGIDSSLHHDEIVSKLQAIGLAVFAPKENVSSTFRSLCDQSSSHEVLLNSLTTNFPKKRKVSTDVASVLGEYISRKSLSTGSLDHSVLDHHRDVLNYVCSTVKLQTHVLFGVQQGWFTHGTGIKRSGRAVFEALFDMRLISVDALVAWMHDKEVQTGKRQLLLQCGGYISDLQNSAIAHQYENSESEDSVDLDNDFPQANRNYDDY